MKKYLSIGAVLIVLLLPAPAFAATVSELQQQLNTLLVQLAATQGKTSTTVSPTNYIAVCPTLTRNLSRRSRGADVTQLQQFLIGQNYLQADSATGFFGAQTESALKAWQLKSGIVSSGSPATTGYGAAGPKTRAMIGRCYPLVRTTRDEPLASSSPAAQPARTQPSSSPFSNTSGGGGGGGGSTASAPVTVSTPPVQIQTVSIPNVMVGFWGIGNISVAGDYISQTAAVSNVAVIPPDQNGSFLPRVQTASALNTKSVLMIETTIFSDAKGTLYPDYQARFDALWNSLSAQQLSIVGFYLIDEPYYHLTDAGSGALSESQLKNNLNQASAYIKSKAPGRPIMMTEAHPVVSRSDFASLVPSQIDYLGVNCYVAFGSVCSESAVSSLISKVSSALGPSQKLMITADGYTGTTPTTDTDTQLRTRIIFWENLLAPYFAANKVGAFTPFIYQNAPANVFGIMGSPLSLTEMQRYMTSVKNGAPSPASVPAAIPAAVVATVAPTVQDLVRNATFQTSGAYSGFPASNVADGDPATSWNAGGSAPQWIQADFGNSYTIQSIRLVAAQDPAGATTHTVYGKGPGASDSWQQITSFQGVTQNGSVLSYQLPQSLSGIRYIKVDTTSSPSWVGWSEINVNGF